MGWSQGGYISAFLTASSDRFAAISVGAGISELGNLLLQHRHHPVHDPVSRQGPGCRPGHLSKDVADVVHPEGEDADPDPAWRK